MARKVRDTAPPDWLDFIGRQTKAGDALVDKDGIIIGTARRGMEVLDPRVMAIPAGFGRPATLADQVRRLVRTEGEETWEDANDFDIADDPMDPNTPWETFYDESLGREVTPEDVRKHWPHLKEEMQKKLESFWKEQSIADMEADLRDRARATTTKREAAEEAAPSSKRGRRAPPAEPSEEQ